MPIRINLDRLLLDRRMSLTELAERVDLTLANLSILKTGRRARSASPRWRRSAPSWTASPATYWSMSQTRLRMADRG